MPNQSFDMEMARPRSDDKRQTILHAAAKLFAKDGLSAPTAQIAKVAGVAQGTIFTYFANKDELLNQLYLELKGQLRAAYADLPGSSDLREGVWQFWEAYVAWGLGHPVERSALARLQVADCITDETKGLAAQSFQDISGLLLKARDLGKLSNEPPALIGSLLVAMAETTIDFINTHPSNAESTSATCFSAFWAGITAA